MEMNKDVFLWIVPLPLVHFLFIVDNLKGQFTSSLVDDSDAVFLIQQFQSFTDRKDSIQFYAWMGIYKRKKQVSTTLVWCHVSVGKTI